MKWGGDPRRYNTMSKQFLKDDEGRVSGVETVLVQWTKVGFSLIFFLSLSYTHILWL